jgi:DNA-binding transcriptional MerR regulator
MFKTKKTSNGAPSGVDSRAYSSTDVAQLAGVSLRQLQWWDEQKVVSPRHEGHKRLYALEEVVEVSVIAELRRKGFSLQKIRRVLKFLQREMGKRLADIMNPESDLHLLTDGRSVYLEGDNNRIIDVMKNARQPMFLVCVTDQVKRLTATPRKPVRSEMGAAARRARAI